MQDRTPWLSLLGGMWIVLGVFSLLWSMLAYLAVPLEALVAFSPAATTLIALFRLPPWSTLALGVGAVLGIVSGWALLRRHSWVQTILIPAHALTALYAAVAMLGVYALQNQITEGWAGSLLFLLVVAVVQCCLVIYMSNVRSTEALSWVPLRTAPLLPTRCEFCGSPLDPETHLCPRCSTIPSIRHSALTIPPRSKLTELDTGKAYWLAPDQPTKIGRGLSDNTINLSNPTVSRRHAQIEYADGSFVITALQDSNGTYVNGSQIRHHSLQDGDEIRFGRVRFQFTVLD